MSDGEIQLPNGDRLDTELIDYAGTERHATKVVVVGALALPGGAATEATLAAARDRLPAALVGGRLAVDVGASALPAGAATQATLAALEALVATLNGLVTALRDTAGIKKITDAVTVTDGGGSLTVDGTVALSGTSPVSVASLPLPAGAAQEHTAADAPHAVRLSNGAAFIAPTTPADTQPVSGTVTAAQGAAGAAEWPVRDDYDGGEVLAQQSGAGAVLTFTFASAVQLVVVESSGDALVCRADPFGGTPSASLGVPCRHETPAYLPVVTSAVKVHAPAGTTVSVWGFRR